MSATRFHEILRQRNHETLARAAAHRLWVELEAGRLSEGRILLWLGQEYDHVRAVERFVVLLGSRAPETLRRSFTEALLHLHEGIERFEEVASGAGIDLRAARVSLGTHAFNSFLLATAATRPFETAAAAYYANSLTFFEGWSRASRGGGKGNLRRTLALLFGEPIYERWLGGLEGAVDEVASAIPEGDRKEMLSIVPVAIEFQTRHWDSIYEEPDA